MTTIKCRYCTDTFPNPLRLRVHTREAHPEHANRAAVSSNLITPVRGPRPGGSLKRDTDTWQGRP